MAEPAQPKRPLSAYTLFSNERRSELMEQAKSENRKVGVFALISEAWKALSDTERATYEEKAAELKSLYEKQLANYKAARYGSGKRAAAHSPAAPAKRAKKEVDSSVPKMPSLGGYGVFASEKRAEIAATLRSKKGAAVTKAVASRWKALSPEEKAPYNEKYRERREAYLLATARLKEAEAEQEGEPSAGEAADGAEEEEEEAGEQGEQAEQAGEDAGEGAVGAGEDAAAEATTEGAGEPVG